MNKENNTYIYSEEIIDKKIEQKKKLQNVSFMALGFTALGASTMFEQLSISSSSDISFSLLITVMGSVGAICAQIAKSDFNQEIIESKEILGKVYKNLPQSQQEELLLNKENSSSTIQAMRIKFLEKNQLNSKLAP